MSPKTAHNLSTIPPPVYKISISLKDMLDNSHNYDYDYIQRRWFLLIAIKK